MKIKDMEIFLDLLNTQSPTHTASSGTKFKLSSL